MVYVYFCIIWLSLCSWGILVFSVPFVAFYNIVECFVFSGCKQFSFCTFLVFRIIFALHDAAYAITFYIMDWSVGYQAKGMMAANFLVLCVLLNVSTMILFSTFLNKNIGSVDQIQPPLYTGVVASSN